MSVHLDNNDLDSQSKNLIYRIFGIDNQHYEKSFDDNKFNKAD